jgi:hypothetical protein
MSVVWGGGVATKTRNPLEPMASVVSALFIYGAGGLVVGLLAAAFGRGSVLGIGESSISLDVTHVRGSADRMPWSLEPGVSANALGYRLFDATPDLEQRIWYVLIQLSGGLLFVGALTLAYLLLRGAERNGIFTPLAVNRLRTLGWFLLVGSLVDALVTTVASNRLLGTLTVDHQGWLTPVIIYPQWVLLVTGAGLLSLARIVRIGAVMRDELQGTV